MALFFQSFTPQTSFFPGFNSFPSFGAPAFGAPSFGQSLTFPTLPQAPAIPQQGFFPLSGFNQVVSGPLFVPGLGFLPLSPDLQNTANFLNNALSTNIALNQAFGGFNVRPTNQTQRVGTFTVTAGVRSDGVKPAEVLVFEKGEFRNRTRGFGFGNFQFDTTLPNARVGKTYQAQIFWEDGQVTTRDVFMDESNERVFISTLF